MFALVMARTTWPLVQCYRRGCFIHSYGTKALLKCLEENTIPSLYFLQYNNYKIQINVQISIHQTCLF